MTSENEAEGRLALDKEDRPDPVAFREFLQSDNDHIVLVPPVEPHARTKGGAFHCGAGCLITFQLGGTGSPP